jgi:ABC-type transport system involved in cytochrome c biogenesis permease subunit
MTEVQRSLPKWILIVSGIIALLEVMVSLSLCFSPQSVLENLDLNAKGVYYVVYMWAVRQFALGFIFGYATIKKSIPMLTLAYIFFLVMMIGDMLVGISQKENSLIMAAIVMAAISSVMIYAINKRRNI